MKRKGTSVGVEEGALLNPRRHMRLFFEPVVDSYFDR